MLTKKKVVKKDKKTKSHHCKTCEAYIKKEHLCICDKCDSEYKF